jgi:ureidoglycolate hydrolase
MDETMKVKVQPLNAEAFRPYGQVLQPKQLVYPEAEEGRVAMEMLHFKYRPNAKRLDQFAIHFSYNQTFIPVQGSMVLVVAPPPHNREAGPEGYELDFMVGWPNFVFANVRKPVTYKIFRRASTWI